MTESATPKIPLTAVFCEGETERLYVLALVKALKLGQYVRAVKTANSAPASLLEDAYKEIAWSHVRGKFPIDEAWLMFDRDHHESYAEAVRDAGKIDSRIRVCWTNPCIEYWFWLHYAKPGETLAYDDTVLVSTESNERQISPGAFEKVTVEKWQRSIRPETMYERLKDRVPSYGKVNLPASLIGYTAKAFENIRQTGQTEDADAVGSAMPHFIARLLEIRRLVYPQSQELSFETAEPPASDSVSAVLVRKPTRKMTASFTQLVNFALSHNPRPSKTKIKVLRAGASRLANYCDGIFAAVESCRHFDKELAELAHLVKKDAQEGFEEPAERAQAALLPLLTTFEARASAFLSDEAKELLTRVVENQTTGATGPTEHLTASNAAEEAVLLRLQAQKDALLAVLQNLSGNTEGIDTAEVWDKAAGILIDAAADLEALMRAPDPSQEILDVSPVTPGDDDEDIPF